MINANSRVFRWSVAMRIFGAAAMIAILAGPAFGQIGPPDKMGGTGYAKQTGKKPEAFLGTSPGAWEVGSALL